MSALSPLGDSPAGERASSLWWVIGCIALAMTAFHIYAVFTPLQAMELRPVHLAFALPLIFLARPTPIPFGIVLDVVLAAAGVASAGYIAYEANDLILYRMGAPNTYDMIFGGLMVLLVLEGARRTIGWGLTIVALVFLAYLAAGHFIPGRWGHREFWLDQMVSGLSLHTEGIFGIPLGVAATYIFLFSVLGETLQRSGAGRFFIDIATATFGRMTGGPAKVAVVTSGFFGSINGSAVANVASTGAYTIPMMKRAGYRPEQAGAIEAAASSGGQIMPPIMGAAGFIIAEFLGISYWSVAAGAAIPAVLYFVALLTMAHFEAKRAGLRPIPIDDLARPREILRRGWFHFLPLVALIFALGFLQYSPQRSALVGIVVAIGVSYLSSRDGMSLRAILLAFRDGALGALPIAGATACAGIVIGVITMTGLGLKLSSMLIALSMGSLFLLLVLTMLASLLLGMGLPTTAAYIILAVLVAPTLAGLDTNLLAAHLFIFYFGAFSAITPPIGVASYVGAAMAKADATKTALLATSFGFAAYLLPFMMIYSPAYVLDAEPTAILLACLRGLLAVIALPAALAGYLCRAANPYERITLALAAGLLVYPDWRVDVAGIALFLAVFAVQARARGAQPRMLAFLKNRQE